MSSIKKDVKEKAPPRPEARRFCLEIQPTAVSVPPDSLERFCSGFPYSLAGAMGRTSPHQSPVGGLSATNSASVEQRERARAVMLGPQARRLTLITSSRGPLHITTGMQTQARTAKLAAKRKTIAARKCYRSRSGKDGKEVDELLKIVKHSMQQWKQEEAEHDV